MKESEEGGECVEESEEEGITEVIDHTDMDGRECSCVILVLGDEAVHAISYVLYASTNGLWTGTDDDGVKDRTGIARSAHLAVLNPIDEYLDLARLHHHGEMYPCLEVVLLLVLMLLLTRC